MNSDVDKLDLSSLRNAVDSLFQSLEIVGNEAWFSAQTIAVRNTLTAGVIQNFEFDETINMVGPEPELSLDIF